MCSLIIIQPLLYEYSIHALNNTQKTQNIKCISHLEHIYI